MNGIDRYLTLLAKEAEADMAVFHTGWVAYTVLPLMLYAGYALLKWYVLLMPITLPLTLWAGGSVKSATKYKNN